MTFGREIVASGGYLILAQGDEVYCDVSSIIGSIGVSIPKYDLKGGLEYLSLERKKIKSNEYILFNLIVTFSDKNSAHSMSWTKLRPKE